MASLQDVDARARASQSRILVVSASQSLASALAAIDLAKAVWVVVIREEEWTPEPYLYAFRPSEVRSLRSGQAGNVPLRVALDLHETGASGQTSEDAQTIAPAGAGGAPSSRRTVVVDADRAPISIIEPAAERMRGGAVIGREPPSPGPPRPGATIDMRLTTQAPAAMRPGSDDILDVLIADASDGLRLPGAIVARVSATEPISVILTIFGDAVVVTGSRVLKMMPPRPGVPSQSAFELHAHHEGTVQAAVIFRQGGSELGSVNHRIRVTADVGVGDRAAGDVAAAPRIADDDGVLLLQVEPRVAGGEIRYQYRVQCPRLGLDFATFESPRLLAANGRAADHELAFVRRIYEHMTNQLLRTQDQIARFKLEVEAFAEDLCAQLFPNELIRLLWDNRDRIDAVRVMSWEPYIPWELVKLAIPQEQKSDERFLSQYGVVRWLAGRAATRSLPLRNWSYFAATYPNNPADNVTREVDYFTTRLPQRGIQPVQVAATYDAFVEALQNPSFDVLHVACHGDVKEDNIERAELVITDELVNGRPKLVSISANAVGKIARFGTRRPLVFLNACEAGRLGESLTTWGGWPSRLINAGAGAVVGASWPVRDVASNAFAMTFYDALLDGRSLSTAASAARTAAAAVGDATWLSFKVFGDPHACGS
jgi:hypothetical protein